MTPRKHRQHVLAVMEAAEAKRSQFHELADKVAAMRQEVSLLETLAGDLASGICPWQWWEPELTCADRQERAAEEAALELADTRERLAAAEAALSALAAGSAA